jgi:PAS domain S-box-containing protein
MNSALGTPAVTRPRRSTPFTDSLLCPHSLGARSSLVTENLTHLIRQFRDGAFTRAITIGAAVALVAAVWCGAWIESRLERQRAIDDVMAANINLSRAIEEHLLRTLKNADQTARVIKAQYEESGSRFDLNRYARVAMIDAQPFNVLSIVDEHGNLVQSNVPAAPVNLKDREHFQWHLHHDTGQAHISKPSIGRIAGKWTFYLSRRLNKRDGSFGGIVNVGIDPEYFAGFFRQLDLGTGSVVTLLGLDGVVRVRFSDSNVTAGQDVSGNDLLARRVRNRDFDSYVDRSRLDGITRVFGYHKLQEYPLLALVGTSQDTALARTESRKRGYFFGAAVFSLLVLLFSRLLLSQLSRRAGIERRLRTVFGQAAVGIGEVALDGRWLEVNQKLCAIFGYARAELLSGNVEDVIPPMDRLTARADIGRLLAGQIGNLSHERTYVRKDGTLIWLSVDVSLVRNSSGAPAYMIGVVADISARKTAEAEAQLLRRELEVRVAQRTAQLSAAHKDMESFTYSVSHDLRTPLRAISGFAQILSRRQRERLDQQGQHYLDNIVEASRFMGILIDDVLRYARLGRQAVTLKAVDLQAVLVGIREQFETRIAALDGALLLPAHAPVVRGDETLLYQIFVNLIENAVTYRKPGTPPRIEMSCRDDHEQVVISVRDNGIGIAAQHHEKIFGVFQRLHTQEQFPGTGIGLATVKRAVDMLNGRVWVESVVGECTIFHVQLMRNIDAAVDLQPGAATEAVAA